MITLEFDCEHMDGFDRPCICLEQEGHHVKMMVHTYTDIDAQLMFEDYDSRVGKNYPTIRTVQELIRVLQEVTNGNYDRFK